MESLPPEKSSTGRANSATTSRMMWTASASRTSSCERRYSGPRTPFTVLTVGNLLRVSMGYRSAGTCWT